MNALPSCNSASDRVKELAGGNSVEVVVAQVLVVDPLLELVVVEQFVVVSVRPV